MKGLVIAVAVLFAALAYRFVPLIIADLPRMRFQRDLKQHATAEELRRWGASVLPASAEEMPDDNSVTNLLPALYGLGEGPPDAWLFADSEDRLPYVRVVYGSAAGHYGVEIGPTNHVVPSSNARRYTAWVPGIWFFDGQ